MSEWIAIESGTPQNGKSVLVSFLNEHGKRHTTKAAFFAAGTLDMDDDVPDDAVDEEGRNVEAGWFEDSEARDPAYWPLGGSVTHWMPLPDPPPGSPHV